MKKAKNGARLSRTRAFCVFAALAATGLTAQAADEVASSGPRFAISGFVVDGNSLLPVAEVDGVLAPFAGPQRSFGDVRRAVEALQQAYLRRGY
ncbi:MAG: POTRA domain-containing protein, partial [Polaromonas sp.]|uniref:POTRA domain-containing protein n=1 Tax=Polaromonas sp. TaxID=1869339 RepID=UPI002735D10D